MRLTKYLAAAAAVCVSVVLMGAGLWSTLPIIGGAAYCASTNVSGNAQGGITGQGGGVATAGQTTGTVICGQTQPAGPATFAGTEVVPMDLYPPGTATQAGGATTALSNILQLGQGPAVVNTTAGAQTIPSGISWYLENVGNTSVTFTLPAGPIEGQIIHFTASTAQTTSALFAANTNQSCVPACPETITTPLTSAGGGVAWRWQASNSTWYRVY